MRRKMLKVCLWSKNDRILSLKWSRFCPFSFTFNTILCVTLTCVLLMLKGRETASTHHLNHTAVFQRLIDCSTNWSIDLCSLQRRVITWTVVLARNVSWTEGTNRAACVLQTAPITPSRVRCAARTRSPTAMSVLYAEPSAGDTPIWWSSTRGSARVSTHTWDCRFRTRLLSTLLCRSRVNLVPW